MFRRKEKMEYSRFYRAVLFCSAAALAPALMPVSAKAQTTASKSSFCSQLGKTIQASAAAQMYCFGPQPNGPAPQRNQSTTTTTGIANVDAANFQEDRGGSGNYAYGQSETSIAASGNYVVEAWNDATGFFNGCGAPMYKEELTGYGFSYNGGASFTDEGGLPNENCSTGSRWIGDPSVGTYTNSGFTYFYVTSLYICGSSSGCPNQSNGGVAVAVSPCQVTGTTLSCGQPVIVATGNCGTVTTLGGSCFPFLDKDFLTIDQARRELYVSFTDFTFTCPAAGNCTFRNDIDLAACDLDNPMAPVCSNGTTNGNAYLTVQPADTVNGCEYEGAYPAVDKATGDVYVAFEYNWATNLFGGPCTYSVPVRDVVAYVPHSCLPDPDTAPVTPTCPGPFTENSNDIVSMDAAFIPGYNRFPMNDFPRIAVSDYYKTVSIVWNDARNKPLGDILLQSYTLVNLDYIQGNPVKLNCDYSFEDGHFLPGLRNTSSDGLINVTWYDRRGANAGTAKTDVYGALNLSPRTTTTPSTNFKVTNESTDWLATSSDIIPNFGDYTDNYVSTSNVLFVAWSDGRSGSPQPYEAHVTVH